MPLLANEQADERAKLERLCRYISRTAIAIDRIKANAKLHSQVLAQPIDDNQPMNPDAANSQEPPEHGRPLRLGWARLLKRPNKTFCDDGCALHEM